MSKNIFFVSDQHFGHSNILKFTGADGKLIRPDFHSVWEMNNTMITNHNRVVGPNDKVYFGGDVCFDNKELHGVMPLLNGEKVLILGNHDKLKMSEYMKYFKSIYGSRRFGKKEYGLDFILSHIPIYMNTEFRKDLYNVHGHIHEKVIQNPVYFNICVERINYTPIELSVMVQKIKNHHSNTRPQQGPISQLPQPTYQYQTPILPSIDSKKIP